MCCALHLTSIPVTALGRSKPKIQFYSEAVNKELLWGSVDTVASQVLYQGQFLGNKASKFVSPKTAPLTKQVLL